MICHNCGAEIPEGVNFCTYCGAEQKPVALKICKKCNYANRLDNDNCKKCGSSLSIEGQEYVLSSTGVHKEEAPSLSPQHLDMPPRNTQKPSGPSLPPFRTDPGRAAAPNQPVQRPPIQQHAPSPFLPSQPPLGQVKTPPQPPRVGAVQPPQPVQRPPLPHQQPMPVTPGPQKQQVPQQPQSPFLAPNVPNPPMPPAVPNVSAGVNKPVSLAMPPAAGIKPPAVPSPIPSAPAPISPTAGPAAQIPAPEAPEIKVKSPHADGFLFCNICGAKNEPGLTVCKYCQSPLQPTGGSGASPLTDLSSAGEDIDTSVEEEISMVAEAPIESPKVEPVDEKTTGSKGKICKKCGTENPMMMLICYNCGETLEDQEKHIEPPFRTTAQYSINPPTPQSNLQPINVPNVPGVGAGQPVAAKGEPSKKICPKCGTPNLLGSVKCGHCGFLFHQQDSFNDDTETKPFLVCPKCYFRNAVDATACVKCGTTLKILPNVKVKEPNEFPSIGDSTVKCPVCGVENPREVLSCKHCNYNFLKKKQVVIEVAPPLIPEGDRITCPRCGSDNGKNEQYCKRCGEKLNKQPTVEIPAYSQQKITAPPVGGIPQPPIPGIAPGANAGIETVDNSFQPDFAKAQDAGKPGKGSPDAQVKTVQMSPPKAAAGGMSVAPPPPIGLPGGGAPPVSEPKVQFVPDWKDGKKPPKDIPAAAAGTKPEKQKGGFSAKTALIIVGVVLGIIAIAVVLMLIDKGGSSEKMTPQSDLNKSTSDTGGLGVEDLQGSETGSSQTKGTDTSAINPTGGGTDTNTAGTQSGIEAVDEKGGEEVSSLIEKGRDALKRGRVNYPRNNNAVYYYLKAKETGAESAELEEFKTQLSMALHSLGDKKLGERSFKDANAFYDLAGQVDPNDASVRRKKQQAREVQRKTEIERRDLDTALKTQSISELENFIDKYPTSVYTAEARNEIIRLKKLKQEAEDREAQRKKDDDARRAYEEKQYVFNVVHSYFMGRNRGKLIISRKGILFEPVDKKEERFYATYSQVSSLVYDDGEIVIKFNQPVGDVGDEISFKHITEADPKTKQIYDAYQELRPK